MKKKSSSKKMVTLMLSLASVCLIATVGFSTWIVINDPTKDVNDDFKDGGFDIGSITDGDNFRNINIKYNEDGNSATLYIPYSYTSRDFNNIFDITNNRVRDYIVANMSATRKHGVTKFGKNLSSYVDVYNANKWRMKDEPHLYVPNLNAYIYSNKTNVNNTKANEDFTCETKFDYSKNYDYFLDEYVDWSQVKSAYTLNETADPSGDYSTGYTTGFESSGKSPIRLRRMNSGNTYTYYLETYVSRYNQKSNILIYSSASIWNVSSITSFSNFTLHNSKNKNQLTYATMDVKYKTTADGNPETTTTLTFNFQTFHTQSGLAYKLLVQDKPIDVNLYKISTDTTTNKTNWRGNITYFLDEVRDVQQRALNFDIDSQYDTYKGYDLTINEKNLATLTFNFVNSSDTSKKTTYKTNLNNATYNYYTYVCDYLNKEDNSFDFTYALTFKKKDGVSSSLKDILSSYLFNYDFKLITEENPKW